MAITELHERALLFLMDYKKTISRFRFRMRKTNRSNRLEQGYWFLGNDFYLAIGFWTGDDWKTKIPNISFIINRDESCSLHFSASDYSEKYHLIRNEILPRIGENKEKINNFKPNEEYIIHLNVSKLEDGLVQFLEKYYDRIHDVIRVMGESKLGIDIISRSTFSKDLAKVLKYREELKNYKKNIDVIKPSRINGIELLNYGPVKRINLESIPENNQWIFITGENGVGKTSFLRGLASVLSFRRVLPKEVQDVKKFEARISLHSYSETYGDFHRVGNKRTGNADPMFNGFAAYGALRLDYSSGILSESKLIKATSKKGNLVTLFRNNATFLNLETLFDHWKSNGKLKKEIERRNYAIKEFLEGILINVGDIIFDFAENEGSQTIRFREIDSYGKLHEPIGVESLSSGYLSIMAMMSDMLVRLSLQQPDIEDPSELQGVVLMDEIDIHLHPNFQKHFVEQLTAAFPKILFIVTTHSPIPLLGAPENSIICVLKRSKERGTYLERVDNQIPLADMLPNSILTSPVFGFSELFPNIHRKDRKIRTEDTFEEIKRNDELKTRLKSIAQKLKDNQ